MHTGIEPAVVHDDVLRIARREQHLERRPALGQLIGELASVHAAGHHDIAEHQIDLRDAFGNRQCVRGVGGLEGQITEAVQLGDDVAAHQRVVLDDENGLAAALRQPRGLDLLDLIGHLAGARQIKPDGGADALLAVDLDVPSRLLDETVDHA